MRQNATLVFVCLSLASCTANLLRSTDDADAPAGSMALLERLVTEQSTQIQHATELAAWASGYAVGFADQPQRPLRLRRRLW